jgi:hypothetical protein
MESLVLEFLVACQANLRCREPVLIELASALGVRPEEVFYGWCEQQWRQRGLFREGKWAYFFHGYECDVWNQEDGRFLRLDFGPRGNVAAFTEWGVTQFIMATKAPWPDFPNLKQHLANRPPPYNERSGSPERAGILGDELQKQGFVESAAPDLLEWERQYLSKSTEGFSVLRLPDGTPERTRLDMGVAGRLVISTRGEAFLATVAREANGPCLVGTPGPWEPVHP